MLGLPETEDTIAAVATAAGEAPLAVIRVSGSRALAMTGQFFRPVSEKDITKSSGFTVHYGRIVDTDDSTSGSKVIDEVLVAVFRAPHSYTAEDMVEISCHGGSFIREEIMRLLARLGARPAAPGEFTKRAFLNGRIDLTQAEAVHDVITARGTAALQNAEEQLNGTLSRTILSLRTDLLNVLSHLEAAIDFPDEDIEILNRSQIEQELNDTRASVTSLIHSAAMGRFLREGIRTVIAGRPNVGKSSLLNRLMGMDRAIVTEVPGTTRDTIEEEVELGGVRFLLVDTAGLTRSQDRAEAIGVERAKHLVGQADLVLFVVDGSRPFGEGDREIAALIGRRNVIRVVNKLDLGRIMDTREWDEHCGRMSEVSVSAHEGAGIDDLEKALVREAVRDDFEAPESFWVTNLRHRRALEEAHKSLEGARAALMRKEPPEIVAVDIKEALDRLGEIVGTVTTDDLLDHIFSQFCIGK